MSSTSKISLEHSEYCNLLRIFNELGVDSYNASPAIWTPLRKIPGFPKEVKLNIIIPGILFLFKKDGSFLGYWRIREEHFVPKECNS